MMSVLVTIKLLFANLDLGEVIGTVIGLVLLVFWVIGQIAESHRKPAAPRQRAPRPARQPPDQADALRGEMDEFLRRARGDGRERQRRPAHPRKVARVEPEIEVLLEEPAVLHQSADSPPRTLVRKSLAPLQPKVPRSNQDIPQRVTVAQHADTAIRSRSFSKQTSHLGEEVALSDDKMESRLHAKFDHNVGRLSLAHIESAYEKQVQTNQLADSIASLLATPQGMQQAIILNEILQRPVERW